MAWSGWRTVTTGVRPRPGDTEGDRGLLSRSGGGPGGGMGCLGRAGRRGSTGGCLGGTGQLLFEEVSGLLG